MLFLTLCSGAHAQKRRRACTNSSAERSSEKSGDKSGEKSGDKSGEKSGDNTNYKLPNPNIFAALAACGARIAALPQPGKGNIGLTGQ